MRASVFNLFLHFYRFFRLIKKRFFFLLFLLSNTERERKREREIPEKMKSTITSLHTTAMATANSNPTNNLTNLAISPPPSSSLNFYKYFNAYYAQQHASDLAQQNLLRQQQLDAIRLIQISLDKLTQQQQQQHQQQSFTNSSSSNTTSVTAKSASAAATTAAASTAYREANLHRNLLVSKVLNKVLILVEPHNGPVVRNF